MNLLTPPPEVAPLDEHRVAARQAHLERELAHSGGRAPRRRRLVRAGAVAAVGLVAAAALLTGRGGGPDVVSRARAAVSQGPYLGVRLHTAHAGHSTLVHLRTHSSERVRSQVEVWFDTRKHGAKANAGGCIRFVGPTTRSGCIGSVFSNGDPVAITGSIDRYRSALASGRVRKTTRATVRGRTAWWLRVAPSSNALRLGTVDYVAVDQRTGNPLRVETRKGARVLGATDIDVIAQVSKLPSYLLPSATLPVPPLPLAPGRRHGRGAQEITLAQAAQALPGALWAGRTVAGQALTRVRVIALDDGSKQIEVLYGGPCPAHCIVVKQGLEAGWAPGSRLYAALPDQSVVVAGGRYGNGRSGKLALRLEGTSKAAILATARALRPIPR